jgi:acyl carrier protein
MNTMLYYMGLMGTLVALLVGAAIPFFLRSERKRKRGIQAAFSGRAPLDEQAFYKRYFQSRGVPADVVFRIRRILERDLDASMSRLLPEDDFTGNLRFFFDHDELVSIYIVEDIEKEFGISISDEASRMHTVNDIIFGAWEKIQQRAA